jgi:hypothetical protein
MSHRANQVVLSPEFKPGQLTKLTQGFICLICFAE